MPALDASDPKVVWSSGLDGKYTVQATRIGDDGYRGELIIWEGDTEIARKRISFAYQAMFGPDVSDVAEWQDWAVGEIDAKG